jgi:Spy/CpxP family protein refolding chaperone
MKRQHIIQVVLTAGLALYGCGQSSTTASPEPASDQASDQAAKRVSASENQNTSTPTSVADRLGLNRSQRAALAKIQEKYRKLSQEVTAQGRREGLNEEEMLKRSLRLRNAYDREVIAILTPEQKKLYEGMKAGG